jgi:cell division protein FtsW (lipid II flippase)
MVQTILDSLTEWNRSKTERQKLQHTYVALTILIIFTAGLISLINADLGHSLVLYGIGALVIFVVNGVVWNLLNSIVLSKLSSKPKNK